MDSQETDNNATECPSDRELNAMKSNPPLPSVFRARPQGPPGSPRHPVNNGPIGQPRPGGQQIRFDNRSPVGPSNSGQFVQHWPYGPPKPSGGSFPHIPVQQGQHPPIVLSPNIPKSPVQCPGPQLGPRLPYPGNYQPQRLQGNGQRPQQQRPEYQTIPQQGQNVEVPAQPQEITQKQLQRNESSLDIPQESLPPKKEDKPAFPRIVVDKMADTDNSKKLQQFENTVTKEKTEIRENVENDDDDDVVMDGKSPRTNGNVTNQEKRDIVQPAKRPETATINGKMDNKPDVTMTKKVDGDDKVSDATANLRSEKPIKDSNMPESDSRLSSAKPAEEVHEASLDKPEIEKIVQELKEPAKRLMENQNVIGKESTTQPVIQTETKSSSIPAATEDKTKNSDSVNESTVPEDSVKGSEDAKPEQNEQKLNVQPTTPEKPRVTTPSKSNEDNSQQLQTPSKSPDKSRGSTPVEVSQDQNQQELKASKSPDKSRATTPAEVTRSQNESEPRPSSKSPQQSRESTPDVPENRNEQELKTLSKSHPITPTEVSQNQTETKKTEDKDDLKSMPTSKTKPDVDSSKEKAEGKDNSLKEKTEDKNDLSKEKAEDKNDEKLDVPLKESDKSRVSSPAEINQKENEAEVSKSSKVVEKSNEKVSSDVDHSQSEKALEDLPSKTPKESTDVAKESDIQAGLEKLQSDKLVQDTSESMKVDTSSSASEKESAKKEESSIALEDEKEVPETKLSRPELSEERVKGFDNGQLRSLSVKSSPSLSPHSPISPKSPKSPKSPQSPKLPKSPIDDEELKENEKKAALPKDSTEQEKSDEKRTPDLKNLSKTITPQKQRALTPEKLDKKPEKKSTITAEIENGSVTNESVQPNLEPTTNGVADSPTKKSPSKSKETDKRSAAGLPVKSPSKSVKSLPRTPETPSSTGGQEKKKLPMNKIQVGAAPSPNLKVVRSKIGSLENASYKPGGGKVKIEMRKLDFSKAQPKIAAKNEKYTPSGGDKKIAQVKLQWNAKPKVGSLENATYKPGGGDKKVGTVKLDFKDKAKPKVGSKDNAKHIPGGGSVKIQTQKIDIKAESKIGSLDNVKHKPGGGDKKIFNDKDYLRQTGSNVESLSGSGSQSPVPPGTVAAGNNGLPTSDENLNQEC